MLKTPEGQNRGVGENKADSSAENVRRDDAIAELKAEVVKPRDDNEESKQLIQDISPEEVVDIPSSVVDQLNNAEQSTFRPSPSVSYQKSLEDETDVFLDDADKKRVSNKIRQRNREKKFNVNYPFQLIACYRNF
jgi:hypothetical protein